MSQAEPFRRWRPAVTNPPTRTLRTNVPPSESTERVPLRRVDVPRRCRDGVRMANELDAQIRDLYAGAPDRFVDERNALAATLKEAGDAQSAKRVKDLKKPTVAAWAVDQLTSRDGATLEELFDAGRQLATAQRQISTPGGAERMREVAETRRRLVDQLVRTAGRALSDAGRPDASDTPPRPRRKQAQDARKRADAALRRADEARKT